MLKVEALTRDKSRLLQLGILSESISLIAEASESSKRQALFTGLFDSIPSTGCVTSRTLTQSRINALPSFFYNIGSKPDYVGALAVNRSIAENSIVYSAIMILATTATTWSKSLKHF